MGYVPTSALGSLRLTVGRQTTESAIEYMLDVRTVRESQGV